MVTSANLERRVQRGRRARTAAVLVVAISITLLFLALDTRKLLAIQDGPKFGQEGKDVEWVPTPDVLVEAMLDLAEVDEVRGECDLGGIARREQHELGPFDDAPAGVADAVPEKVAHLARLEGVVDVVQTLAFGVDK